MPWLPPTTALGDLDVCVVDSLVRAAEQMGDRELVRRAPLDRAYAGYALDHPRELPALWRRYRAARRDLGVDGSVAGDLRVLARAVVKHAVGRSRARLAYNVPAEVLRWRGLHLLRARDVDEAAAVQRRWLDERGVRPQLSA
jgi:hypothetical protein